MVPPDNKNFYPIFVPMGMRKYDWWEPSFLISAKPFFMRKWLTLLIVFCLSVSLSYGQRNRLIVEGSEPNLYLIHTVTPRENFYSIGRMYNISAKQLASYNNLQFSGGLMIGQAVKIPLTPYNFTQSGEKSEGQVLVPLYHSVQPHEGLYRVSIRYNKVPLEILRSWNHLHSDELSVGSDLIIGYLKVSRIQSPLAGEATSVEPVNEDAPQNPPPPVPNTDQSHERLPPVKAPEKKEVESKEPPSQPESQPAETNPTQAMAAAPQQTNPPANSSPAMIPNSNPASSSGVTASGSGGFFLKSFDDQSASRLPLTGFGKGGTFKSTSGWQDGKYYAFSNDAAPGTYIKVTATSSQKSIYAKVLDAIPDIRQNDGLSVIISNSAASALGVGEGVFDCSVNYIK